MKSVRNAALITIIACLSISFNASAHERDHYNDSRYTQGHHNKHHHGHGKKERYHGKKHRHAHHQERHHHRKHHKHGHKHHYQDRHHRHDYHKHHRKDERRRGSLAIILNTAGYGNYFSAFGLHLPVDIY